MGKKFSGVSQTMSRFRGWIQAGATLLTNLHLPNFLKGGLYQGAGKTVCVPGLNCYSCPAASGACPIGAFQAVVGSSKFSFSYYITGFLILLSVLLGRFTEDELKLLKEAAEKICEIENKLTMIEKKYPEAAQQSTDGATQR